MGCHMSIGGGDGKGLMRREVEYLTACGYEDQWADIAAVVFVLGWLDLPYGMRVDRSG